MEVYWTYSCLVSGLRLVEYNWIFLSGFLFIPLWNKLEISLTIRAVVDTFVFDNLIVFLFEDNVAFCNDSTVNCTYRSIVGSVDAICCVQDAAVNKYLIGFF